MKTRTKVLIAVGVTASAALAQFTTDALIQAKILAEEIKQYEQLRQEYETMNAQLHAIENGAKWATHKEAWIPSTVPNYGIPTTPNTYGTSAGWIQAISNGSNVMGGYSAATVPLKPYSSAAWSSLSPSQQDTVGRQYATVELTDSVNQNALAITGSYRAQQNATNAALAQLSAKANSQDPLDNTPPAIANLQVATALASAREQQATNQLLATLVEQNAVSMKTQRDSQALGIAADVAERTVPSQPIGAQAALAKRWN